MEKKKHLKQLHKQRNFFLLFFYLFFFFFFLRPLYLERESSKRKIPVRSALQTFHFRTIEWGVLGCTRYRRLPSSSGTVSRTFPLLFSKCHISLVISLFFASNFGSRIIIQPSMWKDVKSISREKSEHESFSTRTISSFAFRYSILSLHVGFFFFYIHIYLLTREDESDIWLHGNIGTRSRLRPPYRGIGIRHR